MIKQQDTLDYLPVAMILAFLSLSVLYLDFILDDAFILFRYALNLAEGHGFVWNPGEDPVEGFSSHLWVWLHAAAIKVGLSPVGVSKAAGVGAAVWMLVEMARISRGKNFLARYVFLSALALWPPAAFLAMQGMSTMAAALFMLLETRYAARMLRHEDTRWDRAGLFAAMVLAFFTRMDTALYSAPLVLGVLVTALFQKRGRAGLEILGFGFVAGLCLGLFMLWRVHTFGYFFPNTYYVKIGGHQTLVKPEGIEYTRTFLIKFFWPYLAAGILLPLLMRGFKRLPALLPPAAGFAAFMAYGFTIHPMQGFFWRFLFPVVPALLYALLEVMPFEEKKEGPPRIWIRIPVILTMIFFLGWPMRFLGQTFEQKDFRAIEDRILIGKVLEGIDGTMAVTEAGALPYYSRWRVADLMGLNTETIAHEGLRTSNLYAYDPDLVMALYSPKFPRHTIMKNRVMLRYLRNHGFVAVAAIHKTQSFSHLYFVKRSSPLFAEIVGRLLGRDDVTYRDLDELVGPKKIPIYRGQVDRKRIR